MRRHPSTTSLLLALAALGGTSLLAGCGGSDDDSGSNTGSNTGSGSNASAVRTGVDIVWSARSRALVGPSSALSARITFVGGSANSTDVTTIADRRDDPASYTSTYATPVPIRTGGVTIRVEYYSGRGASGSRVGVAETGAILKPDGTLSRADGSDLGFVTAATDLASVTLVAPSSIAIGTPTTLGFTALSRQGEVVALTPGSAIFSLQGGNGAGVTLTPDGILTGTQATTVTIRVQLDGLADEATVTITAANNGAVVEIAQPVSDLVYSASRNRLLATAPGTAANANRLFELDPATGAIGNSFQIGSEPGPIGLSSDGRIAWVGLSGSSSIRRIDLTTGSVGAPISLGASVDGPYAAIDIAVSPVDPETIAVAEIQSSGFSSSQTALFRNGIAQPDTITGFSGNGFLAFGAAGDEVYGLANSFNSLTRNVVTATGLTQSQTTGRDTITAGPLVVAGTRLFASDGRVVNTADFSPAGRFGGIQGPAFALDPSRGLAYFVADATSNTGTRALQLQTFSTESYALLSTRTIPANGGDTFGQLRRTLVVAGTDRLVLATTDGRILLIDLTKL